MFWKVNTQNLFHCFLTHRKLWLTGYYREKCIKPSFFHLLSVLNGIGLLVSSLATNLMALGSNPTRDILQWFRVGLSLPRWSVFSWHAQITRDESHIFFINFVLFNFMFFAVNNEVETRREEHGYEVGQNRTRATFWRFWTIFEIFLNGSNKLL